MKFRRPRGLGPELHPSMLRSTMPLSRTFSCLDLLFDVVARSGSCQASLIVVVLLLRDRKVAGQSNQGCQAEKDRAEDGCEHHLSPVLRISYLTMTQPGCSSGNAMRPTTAVAAISSGLLTFQRNRTASDAAAISAVNQSPMAICPSRMEAPRIVPIAAPYAPLTNPWTLGFPRWRARSGAATNTRIKDGKKIPTVETSEPQKPATR